MFWDKQICAAWAGAIGLGILAVPAAQAQSVVVRSTGPSAASFPQGKRIAANERVALRAGDEVTVLDRAGTRVLRGPGNFTLDGRVVRNQTTNARVNSFITRSATGRARTGAVRGGQPAAVAISSDNPANIWQLDIRKGGNWCVADPATLVLWRSDRTGVAQARLTGASGGAAVVDWRNGNPLKQWPQAALPVVEGASYRIAFGSAAEVAVTTRLLPNPPAELDALAAALIDRGCNHQLDQLLGVIAASTPPVASP